MEWAPFSIALVFPGVSPVDVENWDAEDVLDALAVIDELNADTRRRERQRR